MVCGLPGPLCHDHMCINESFHTQTPLLEVPSLFAHSSVLHSSYILMHTKWGVALAVMQLPGLSVRHHTEEQHPSVGQSRRGLDLALCMAAASCCCKPSHLLRPICRHSPSSSSLGVEK